MDQTVVFVHGVGGPGVPSEWEDALSDGLARLGRSRPERSGITLVGVDYHDLLFAPGDPVRPETSWKKPSEQDTMRAEYQIERAAYERVIETHRNAAAAVHLGQVPDDTAALIAEAVESVGRDLKNEAGVYRRDEKVRDAVHQRVLSQMPAEGRIVLIGHSLGSVVAANIVKLLPRTVTVDLLLTIGSPIPIKDFWPRLTLSHDGFPYERVKAWVNIFDTLDPVTAGRGVAREHPDALDVDLHLGSAVDWISNHQVRQYLSVPVTAAVVGHALYGGRSEEPSLAAPARPMSRDWDLHLLAAAYAQQIDLTCDLRRSGWRRRFNAARRASVTKLVADIEAKRSELADDFAANSPGEYDLLDHATGLVRHHWADEELLPLAISLALSSPVQPFQIEIAEKHTNAALTSLVNRVRRPGVISDQTYAKAIAEAIPVARSALGAGGGPVWAYLLIGGAVVLAATGVGLWAAAPAGLAGAAALTATLAAFGPGGMVGGMLTIATGAGLGSALVAGGSVASASEAERNAAMQFGGGLAEMSAAELRSTLVGMLATLEAQRRLGFESTAPQARQFLVAAMTKVTNELNEHKALESRATDEWEAKRKQLDKALEWTNKIFPDVLTNALIDTVKGKESTAVHRVSAFQIAMAPQKSGRTSNY